VLPSIVHMYNIDIRIALVQTLGLQGDDRMHARRRINFIEILLNLGQKKQK